MKVLRLQRILDMLVQSGYADKHIEADDGRLLLPVDLAASRDLQLSLEALHAYPSIEKDCYIVFL